MSQSQPGIIRIGTAGWSIPARSAQYFPAEGSHLERYAATLNAVEINSSFYRPHQPKTYARWADTVPDGFRFSVKMPRTITHDAGLRDIDEPLTRFAGEASALGEKLGCVLVQLPPKLAFEAQVAQDFLRRVHERFSCRTVLEARHPSWFADEVTGLLSALEVTRVIADPPKGQPGEHVPTTSTIYARLHGSPRVYYSPYAQEYLEQLGRDTAAHARAGRDVWIIFDNTLSPTYVDELMVALASAQA